jgi:hypothetical protein
LPAAASSSAAISLRLIARSRSSMAYPAASEARPAATVACSRVDSYSPKMLMALPARAPGGGARVGQRQRDVALLVGHRGRVEGRRGAIGSVVRPGGGGDGTGGPHDPVIGDLVARCQPRRAGAHARAGAHRRRGQVRLRCPMAFDGSGGWVRSGRSRRDAVRPPGRGPVVLGRSPGVSVQPDGGPASGTGRRERHGPGRVSRQAHGRDGRHRQRAKLGPRPPLSAAEARPS